MADGIVGESVEGIGVKGTSKTKQGVWGESDGDASGVVGISAKGHGVKGESRANRAAVVGVSTAGKGVVGKSEESQGVWGETNGAECSAVYGKSARGPGVKGDSQEKQGVWGISRGKGSAVYGTAHGDAAGVKGISEQAQGVWGQAKAADRAGVVGVSAGGHGVVGQSESRKHAGVVGRGPKWAGRFEGDVEVTGDIFLKGADYAEALTVASPDVAPGMVVVLDDEGRIRPCTQEYDARVAGIVSGAGGVRPALVLDRHDGGAPVALMGKLWVMADAIQTPIHCGDLLTTSAITGHAQRALDRDRAFGAIIGKALTDLPAGRGMVRALVSAS